MNVNGPLVPIPDAADLDAASDPGQFVIASCERAKAWLAQCLEGGHIEAIVETKSQAEAIRVYAMQKQLGKDAELSAAEVVRRAERCIGLAIRKGQTEGRIRRRGHVRSQGTTRASSDFSESKERADIYAMADDVTDEQFEEALVEAKAERNLSRANVVRRVKSEKSTDRWKPLARLAADGHSSDQIAKKLGVAAGTVRGKARALGIEIPADRILNRGRRTNHDRVLSEFVNTLESLVPSIELINLDRVDPRVLKESCGVLVDAMNALVKFRRKLREASNGAG